MTKHINKTINNSNHYLMKETQATNRNPTEKKAYSNLSLLFCLAKRTI